MKSLNLKLFASCSLAGLAAAGTASAWTVAVDNFDAYEEGVALRDQTNHGGVGFAGDWIETASNVFWTPLYGATTDSVFDGAVTQDGRGVISGGGRHMRALTHPQDSGTVYVSTLMMNVAGTVGSSQLHLNSDTQIKDGEGTLLQGLADIIGGIRYDGGILQYVDPTVLHVDDDPATTDIDERRNLNAIIPGRDGFTDDDPPKIAYNEYWMLAETYVDMSDRATPIATDILWVIKYNLDADTMSYYAFLPGDELTEAGASYSAVDLAMPAGRASTLGVVSLAAWGSGVNYEHVKVGTTWGDVVPVVNNLALAPMLRAPVAVDGVVDDVWDAIPGQSYGLKHGDGTQPADAADASGSWKAAWDADNLYLLFEAIDDEHFEGTDGRQDEVEFWTDTDFSRNHTDAGWPAVYDKTDTQWVTRFIDGAGNGFANRWQHAGSPLPADRKDITGLDDASMVVQGVVENLDGGGIRKIVEVSVAWADLAMDGPPAFGRQIGFESQLNDRDASTGTNPETSAPVYGSDGKAAWADGNNRAWISPSSFGVLEFIPPVTPILDYDFSDLTVGAAAAGAGTDDANWTGPWLEAWRPAWAAIAANGAVADPFIGDLAQDGIGIIGVNAGRLSRTMDTTFDSGVVWTSLVLGDDTASTQFWLGDSSQFDLNSNTGIVAGVRMQSGSVQVINTILNRDSKETYVNAGVYPNAPVLVVIMLDYDNNNVGYWIFESGLPVDPANPSAFYEFTLPRSLSLSPFSGVAWAGFNGRSVISNLRVGDQLSQVVPASGVDYNCPVLVSQLHEPVSLDGSVIDFAWERTNGLALGNYWMDAGKNVLPSGDADFAASFHTGWNGNTLNIAVIVNDEDVRNAVADGGTRDSVEIYIDGDNSDNPSIGWPTNYDQVDDYQLVFALNADRTDGADISGSWFGNPTGNPDGYKGPQGANAGQDFAGITWQVGLTDSGYVLEIALDMTVVPGLDTFLANGLMGFDVAVVDNDDTGELDIENAPIIEKTHAFFCDDNNWNWNGTAHLGTAYVTGAMTAIAMFGNGQANVPLAGDAAAGSGVYEVNTNFTDVAYAIAANQNWVTIDFDPGVGAGEVEFSWSENTGLYQRAARIQLSGAIALNRIDLTQAGIAPQALATLFPAATAGDVQDSATDWLGVFHYGLYPWLYIDQLGWAAHIEGSKWVWSPSLGDYLLLDSKVWPFVYAAGEGDAEAGWLYVVDGDWVYDFTIGDYLQGPVFP